MTKTLSFAVRAWRDPQAGETRLQVLRVDRPEEVRLINSSFLVRVTIDQHRLTERCTIRHVASGREAFVQGGPGLSAFVQVCLLENAVPPESGANEEGQQEQEERL